MNARALKKSLGPLAAIAAFAVAWLGAVEPSFGSNDDLLTKGEKRYSQFDEELIIRHFFDDRRDGFFVDVGAYHWKKNSTTYFLEKHRNWSGIAIDALEQLRAGYEENRPRSKFFNYIVTDHSGTVETLYGAGALSSTDEAHLEQVRDTVKRPSSWEEPQPTQEVSERHAKQVSALKEKVKRLKDFEPKSIQVPTITLTELLDQNGVKEIDLLSMDIEGSEPAALAGFDIDRFKPKLVCIEVTSRTAGPIGEYFEAHGYECIDEYKKYDTVNWYFRPKPPVLQRSP